MKKMSKRVIALILVLVTMQVLCAEVFYAELSRALYTEDGRVKYFPESKIEAQLKVGWYEEPVQRLYAPGKSKVFKRTQVQAQLKVGWYYFPVERLYAPGKSEVFETWQVEQKLKEGWYLEPVQILYAPGKSKVFKKSQVEAQLKVGWYLEPVVLMTALDGRTKYVEKSKVAANKKVGWYEGKPVKVYAEDGRTKYISSVDIEANEKVGWYTEPVQRLYAPGKSKPFKKSQVAAQLKVGWYTYPVTKIVSPSGASKIIKTADKDGWVAKGWVVNNNYWSAYYATKDTQRVAVNNWASVSAVQQFKYMNKGIGYGYISGENLVIVTPDREIKIRADYALLGDINSDSKGNLYVVWGNQNMNGDEKSYKTNTVFISKYSPTGAHIKTTGFCGESPMGESGNTKDPFYAGTCHSTIANGIMMVNYARGMYNGHQSNNVIGVYVDTMKPYEFESEWDVPYTSHSFNQRVIWSKKANGFIYADQGDAYGRGFIITPKTGYELNIFNFYLQANANYNMGIVNKTFAQMGSLLETDKGVMLVGASAKSIGENAKTEKQNLFVQIFDPTATEVTKSMFVGGQERKGKTSFNIYDNSNSPLTPVTNYGVHWLTNYTNVSVIAPHAVVAGNKIVILWSLGSGGKEKDYANGETFYMVLDSAGKVIKPATGLDKSLKLQLNSMEDPIYHNGKVYWVSGKGDTITVESIKID